MILTAKNGRESTFAEVEAAGSFVCALSHMNTNGVEVQALAQFELYRTGEGDVEVRDASDTGRLLTTMTRYDRCRFMFRGSPRTWEQIA